MPRSAQAVRTRPAPHRSTIAAVVYFLYGLCYLFGAQYLTSLQDTQRSMGNAQVFFLLGGVVALTFPLLIFSRFALAFSWSRRQQRLTLSVDFTFLLGLLVVLRVVALLRNDLWLKSPLHTTAVLLAACNAACLLWAGLARPVWITRQAAPSE